MFFAIIPDTDPLIQS